MFDCQASPRIRFNKEGTLLAVSAIENGFKILANTDGLRLLRTLENRTFDNSQGVSEASAKVFINFLSGPLCRMYMMLCHLTNSPALIHNAACNKCNDYFS